MHEAYEVTHLINAQVQIETIAAYDTNLLIGTRQGHLLLYSLSNQNGNQKFDLQLLRYCKNFSKKPIQQIEVIPDDNLLLCLSDNVLSLYDINGVSIDYLKTLEKTKGASMFSLHNKPTKSMTGEVISVSHVCVAVRRKLQLYYGKCGDLKQHIFDFTIPDIPRTISCGQQYLCVGFKSEYILYDLSTGKPKELFPVSSSRSMEPTVAKYTDTCFILGRDQMSVFIEESQDMNLQSTMTVKWSEAPTAVVWDEPYLLGLVQDQVLVQCVEPTMFVQTLHELHKARLLYKCKRGLVFAASVGQVWCISAVDATRQRHALLNDKQFQLAIKLTDISEVPEEEKKQTIQSIQTLHALDLFERKLYAESVAEFIRANTDPAEVIRLFPDPGKREPNESGKPALDAKDNENAVRALIDYLTKIRLTLDSGSSGPPVFLGMDGKPRSVPNLTELVYTTLVKCYVQTNDAMIAPLLKLRLCQFEETERVLAAHGKHGELIVLYQTAGQHGKALQLLREQAGQHDSSLRGLAPTKKYLQELGADHLNLIFKHSEWLLREHPEEGLKIFTDDVPAVENLPRPKVLDFLLREHEALAIPYLEHVVHYWGDTDPLFHNALIKLYREKVTDKKNVTEEESRHTRAKLLRFLEESRCYTAEVALLHLPPAQLFEERAQLLGRLGQHEQALLVYVLVLGDVEKAIKYCETVSKRDKERSQDVYVTLIRILVQPQQSPALSGPLASAPRHPRTSEPDLETALQILEKHADQISPLKVLAVLPDSILLSRIRHFLQSALDTQICRKRKTQVLKGLTYAEHMQVREQLQAEESRSLVVSEYDVCRACRKRFNNQSAFVRYPSGELVHYNCRLDK